MGALRGGVTWVKSDRLPVGAAKDARTGSERVLRYMAGEPALEVLGRLDEELDIRNCQRIGSGSLGDVLLVEEPRGAAGPQKLAVKVISLWQACKTGDEARLRYEVKVMSALDHPNIVRLVDVLTCEKRLPNVSSEPPYLCIVMEYVGDSEPLSGIIRQRGPQPALVHQVLLQLASALALMHQQGIVHRDVWSENVLVSKQGHVVLVDLGCAEYVNLDPAARCRLNVPYMSPEAASCMRQQPGDDCWALGLLITEIVTGRFIADRLGTSKKPIHAVPQALGEALRETASKGSPLHSKLATQLLDLDSSRRISVGDVVMQLQVSCSASMRLRTVSPPAQRVRAATGGASACIQPPSTPVESFRATGGASVPIRAPSPPMERVRASNAGSGGARVGGCSVQMVAAPRATPSAPAGASKIPTVQPANGRSCHPRPCDGPRVRPVGSAVVPTAAPWTWASMMAGGVCQGKMPQSVWKPRPKSCGACTPQRPSQMAVTNSPALHGYRLAGSPLVYVARLVT